MPNRENRLNKCLHLELHLLRHLPDDVRLRGGSVLFVVNGEQGDVPFVLGNDDIGRYDTGIPLRCPPPRM